MCCSRKISKLILFIFNIVFFLLGAGALALGIFLIVDKGALLGVIGNIPGSDSFNVDEVLNSASYLENAAYMLIGAGAVIFFIAFCGLCGGLRESACLLYIYSVLVGLILCIQIAAGVMCYFYGNEVQARLQGWFTTLLEDRYEGATITDGSFAQSGDSTGISDAIDVIQVSLECCGVTNLTNYESASQWPGEYNYTSGGVTTLIPAVVPITCCKMVDSSLWPSDLANIEFVDLQDCITYANASSTNLDSCYGTVLNLLDTYSIYAIGVGIGVACLELFGIIAACCIIHDVKKDQVNSV